MNNNYNNNNYNNNNYNGGFPTWGGTDTSSFPTWWSGTDTTTTSDNIVFTTSTNDAYSGNILSLTANTTWNNYNNYDVWPKGVQDPSNEFKYSPKWHILLGYEIQIPLMWD